MLWLSCSISKPQLRRGGHLSVPPTPAANHVLCPCPHLGSQPLRVSYLAKSQITFVVGDRLWQGGHPWGADPGSGPGAGWAGRLRGAELVLEGSSSTGSHCSLRVMLTL